MSDYIKKEDAENIMLGSCDESALWKLRHIPPADVVEVVRCKDCIYVHANKNNRQLTCNRRMLGAVRPNDYCSLGAYESEEEQNHE